MVMDTMQIRITPDIIKRLDKLVKTGLYANRSDVVRDAVRRFIWATEVGTIKSIGDSVELVRKARKDLSKNITKKELERINNL